MLITRYLFSGGVKHSWEHCRATSFCNKANVELQVALVSFYCDAEMNIIDMCNFFSFLHDLWVLVSHLIPAYAADLGYMLLGKKPR
jgi:hypothetical protein